VFDITDARCNHEVHENSEFIEGFFGC